MSSFHGTTEAPDDIVPDENYWLLIGEKGTVVDDQKRIHPAFSSLGSRLLVKFDKALSSMGLHCHNPEGNTLWIFEADLT